MARDAIESDMKYFVCFIITFFALESCSAQQAGNDFSKRIQIPSNYLRLDTITSLISRQSHLRLSMDTRKFPPFRLIHLQKGFRPISSVLDDIQKNIGNEYKVFGDHIIFIEKHTVSAKTTKQLTTHVGQTSKPSSAPQKTFRSRTKKQNDHLSPPILPPISSNLSSNRRIIAASDNPSRIILPDHVDSIKVNHEVSRFQSRRPAPFRRISPKEKPGQDHAEKKENILPILLEAGISTNELLYINPTIMIGVPLFYGVGTWGSNFNLSGFQWGIGTSFGIDDRWRVKLQAISGKFKRSHSYDSLYLGAAERLYKLGISAEKELNTRLKLEVGISLNVLDTRYSISGAPTVTSSVDRKDLADRLDMLSPPYTIIDHYSLSSKRNGKFWIGMQVGLLYDLIFFRTP